MRQRGDVFDRFDGQSRGLQCRDRTFPSAAGALHFDFHFLNAELRRLFRRLLSGHLPGERRAFARAFEAGGPVLAQHKASPLVSVIVTVVLLNVALMKAMPTVTLRRAFRRVFA